jgi:FKBP-type peptidyl-prolyl cis-trans isomerase|nr:FKBP-type peptidylprolyl isomerase [uncultured Flavobacterium sp.]
MSKIKFYFILLIAVITVNSCNKDDDNDIEIVPPRDFSDQYKTESALIEKYLKSNYITVMNASGEKKDQDVTIAKLDADHTVSIWDQKDYALLNRKVGIHGITYVLYYLVLREGEGEKPCNVDDVFTSYNGKYLTETTTDNVTAITSTQFEEVIYPQAFMNLYNVIRGWKEVFPQFKSGDISSNPDGTVKYTNFGAGVMFIPSGLAYYNSTKSTIPAYSPLVFSFKLYKIKRSDFEPDGVLSYQEDSNGDGYVWMNSELQVGVTVNPDDTDKDGTPDFIDFDDDGDNYATRGEVKDKDGNYYAFDLIPDCSGNIPTEREKKRHLDPTCTKMNQ